MMPYGKRKEAAKSQAPAGIRPGAGSCRRIIVCLACAFELYDLDLRQAAQSGLDSCKERTEDAESAKR
jgi:hypothetical protein